MTDYGHDLLFGTFVTPVAQPPLHGVEIAIASERAGLDLVTFQDHPYQPAFLDTWTLLSFAAARTRQIHLASNVINLPLRHPALLARSAASLDRLSGGRFELGMGAGAFWEGIAAMGGRRLTPGQSIEALEEAIRIIRDIWNTEERGGVRVEGQYYQVKGARRGPPPAHKIGIWIGAYKPRMLRLTGRLAEGWLPSLSYIKGGVAELAEMNRQIDEGAAQAGRDPAEIRRLANLTGKFTLTRGSFLEGPPEQWAEDLAEAALEYGMSGFLLAADDPEAVELFAHEVAPAARELVAAERARRNPVMNQ